MPAYCSTRSTMSPRRRASASSIWPYRFTRSPLTTPEARFSAAERMTATGVRSSCDTPATNSICCCASRSARRDVAVSITTANVRSSRMPELMARLRRRIVPTAASSDPLWCCTSRRQRAGISSGVALASWPRAAASRRRPPGRLPKSGAVTSACCTSIVASGARAIEHALRVVAGDHGDAIHARRRQR